MDLQKANNEIRNERRSVGFDAYDITIKQLTDMVVEGQVNISPDYQRKFVWDPVRQSQLIESIFLGIPIPSLFLATNEDSTWEVIDGLQRITTLLRYVDPGSSEKFIQPEDVLVIRGLEKIPSLNGSRFQDLPGNMKLNFSTRPIRITVLNDMSDFKVRFDLFERLNTGGIVLHEQEIRNCVFQGKFNDFIKKCAKDERLNDIIKRNDRSSRGNTEELVLKFFAYFEDRENFRHSVKEFLNEYMEKKTNSFTNRKLLSSVFDRTVKVLADSLPNGVVRSSRPNSTPLVLFEAIAVGVADVLSEGGEVSSVKLRRILDN